MSRSRFVTRIALVCAAVVGCWTGSSQGGEWPAYARDAHRSNATDEPLDFPLRCAWSYRCAQPPRPAWPEPVKTLNRFDFDYAFQPVAAGGLVCFGSSADDTVRALDAATGAERWHYIAGGPIRFAPQIEQGRVFFSSDDGFVYCLDASTGHEVWKFSAAPADDHLIGNERMISRWPERTGVLVDNGVVYATAGMWPSDGIFVYALDAASGKVLWCNDTSGLIYDVRTLHLGADFATYGVCPQGPLLASDDLLLVPTGKALPAAFDRKTGKLRYYRMSAEFNTRGGTWVTIAGKNFYTTPYIVSYSLATGEQTGRPVGGGAIPDYSKRIPGKAYETYEKVSAIVAAGGAYARKAYGMVKAGPVLVIGQEDQVMAESTAQQTSAEIRFGLAGDDLAVHAFVKDRKVVQSARPWNGSCVEVFGAMPGQATIGQVFLIPGSKTAPPVAYRSQGGQVVASPEIRIKSAQTAKGYNLSALIPLKLLALDKANPDFRLEAQVTVPGPDGTLRHGTLFGSVTAHQDSAKFGPYRLKPQNAMTSPEQVQAALAGVNPVAITMAGSSELWRAGVEGEARGLAVANGRLYVSTSRGMIYAFEPGGGGERTEASSRKSAVSSQESESAVGSAERSRGAGGTAPSSLERQPVSNGVKGPGSTPAAHTPSSKTVALLCQVGMDRGYALVVGDAAGAVARELAEATDLQMILPVVGESAARLLRERLLATTEFYGSRIHVVEVKRLDALPFAQYFANAVVVAGPSSGVSAKELYRLLRPCGGLLVCAGIPAMEAEALVRASGAPAHEIRNATQIVRGKLPGALDWDSPFALDQRVKWPLRLLWFGGPGPAMVMDRKQMANIGPVASGRLFVFNQDTLSAVDVYNGTVLWSRPIPRFVADLRLADGVHPIAGADRIGNKTYGRGLHADGSNVYLTLNGYFPAGAACVQIDARTGVQKNFYGPYAAPTHLSLASPQTWPLEVDAAHGGAVSLQLDARGLLVNLTTKDPVVTKLDRWDLYFDLRPASLRYGLYDRGTFSISVFPADGTMPATWKKGSGVSIPEVRVDGSRAAGATATSVLLTWEELAKLTGGKPASFGFGVRLNACDNADKDHVVQSYLFCDLAADGLNNGWANIILDPAVPAPVGTPSVVAGPFASLPKLPALKGRTATPGSQPAAQAARRHPLTGAMGPKLYQTGGICGGPAFSAFGRYDRSTAIAIYDFADDSGTRTFDGVKPGCATTMTAAQGLLLSVEGRGGCTCTFNFQTSLALASVEKRWNEDWALFYDRDADSRIVSAALNLGAPGDRRADDGTLWLSYPRLDKGFGKPTLPPNVNAVGVGQRDVPGNLRVPLTVEVFPGGETYRFNADRTVFSGTDRPWIYASGYRGIRKATLKLDFGAPVVSTPVTQPPALDGNPGDPAWSGQPQARLPASKTDVFLRHDGDRLYILARRPSVIAKTGEPVPWIRDAPKPGPQDDQSFYNDCCWEVFLGDARSGRVVHLRVMPSGAKFDALSESSAAADENVKWNGDWSRAVVADGKGFTIEMAIPWKTLADAGLDRESLAANFMMNGPFRQSEALRFPGMRGRARCEQFVPVAIGASASAAAQHAYTVRLHFAEPDADAKPGQRVFDVKIQEQTVLKDFDIAHAAGNVRTALAKEFKGVQAGANLTLEFVPAAKEPTAATAPILCAVEVLDEGFTPSAVAGAK